MQTVLSSKALHDGYNKRVVGYIARVTGSKTHRDGLPSLLDQLKETVFLHELIEGGVHITDDHVVG